MRPSSGDVWSILTGKAEMEAVDTVNVLQGQGVLVYAVM